MPDGFDSTDIVDLGDAVTIAYVHGLTVTSSWFHSMTELYYYDIFNNQRIARGGNIAMTAETDGLAKARNKVVETFLKERNAPWLFIVDTDMGFTPDTIERLLASADPEKRPIVGALAFTQRQEKTDHMGGWRTLATPTIFDWAQDGNEEGFKVRWDYHVDALQQCNATGSAAILIHRDVFEKIAERFGPNKWYDRFFNPTMQKLTSEDLSFCMRAETVGCPIYVDAAVKTTHQKPMWLQESDYFAQRTLAELIPEVPPATEPTAVIVPVLGRPQNAKPFMESLRASGADLAKVYVVCDPADWETFDEWRHAGAKPLLFNVDHGPDDPPGTFAEKVNFGYKSTDEPWLFLVGDDVKFHPGWLDHAQHASRDGAHVIGTNDLHNPLVLKGEHATHLMVRRAYVDERGASWDGPKIVCHEGYRHMFVDDEVVAVAKQRGVWAFAEHSKVEHLHPLWGGAEPDETYRLGASFFEQDRELFTRRLQEFGAGA